MTGKFYAKKIIVNNNELSVNFMHENLPTTAIRKAYLEPSTFNSYEIWATG